MNIVDNGFEEHKNFLSKTRVHEIIKAIDDLNVSVPRHGIRHADKKLAVVREIAHSGLLKDKAAMILNGEPQVVRGIIFDKTPDKNWLVPWHQDKTIAVNKQVEIENWGPWTIKDGVHHVQPEIQVLENMVTFRLHLDDADENNGCLRVIPNTHKLGILSDHEQRQIVNQSTAYNCLAKSGDLLIMRPHLLHASSKAESPLHRRVVHIEYSSFELPMGLTWV